MVEAQSRLYGTKSAADCAVLAVLLMHRLYPHSDWPAYVDSSVSVCISLLLAASGITVMNRSIGFLSGTNTADPSTSPPGSSRPGNSRPATVPVTNRLLATVRLSDRSISMTPT